LEAPIASAQKPSTELYATPTQAVQRVSLQTI
jgi:hypothetical protein